MSSQASIETTASDREKTLAGIGTYSFVGLLILLFGLTVFVFNVNYSQLVMSIWSFVSGGLSQVPNGLEQTTFTKTGTILAAVVLTIPISLLVGILVHGKDRKDYDREGIESALDKGSWVVFAIVAAEEIFTRIFLLGVVAGWINTTWAFYLFFIVGNSLWAVIHVTNFTKKNQGDSLGTLIAKGWYKTLPQFIGGIVFTYIFVLYGGPEVILAHYFYNVVLMSSMKEKMPHRGTFMRLGYYIGFVIVLLITAQAMGIGLKDLAPWVNNTFVALEGYSFWNYAVLLLLVDAISVLIAGLLLLDSTDLNQDSLKTLYGLNWIWFIVAILLTSALLALVYIGVYQFLGVFNMPLVTRALIMAIGFSLLRKTSSGSSMARATLVTLPPLFFNVVAISVLGFWTGFGLFVVFSLADAIPHYIRANYPDEVGTMLVSRLIPRRLVSHSG